MVLTTTKNKKKPS